MKNKTTLVNSLLVLNGFSVVLAIAVMGLSLWLRFEWDFKHYVYELQAEKILWTGPYILMASSCLAMAAGAIGIYASVIEDCKLLLVLIVCSTASFILGLAGVSYTLTHGIFRSNLTPLLEDRFWVLFHEMDSNERSARALRIIQEDIECCGATNWVDYPAFNKELPSECRNPATGNIQAGGCAEEFALWLEPKTGWLSGLALLLVTIQLVSITISFWLRKVILFERTRDKTYRRAVGHR